MDDFDDIKSVLTVLVGLVFYVGPFILRMLKKRSEQPQEPKKTKDKKNKPSSRPQAHPAKTKATNTKTPALNWSALEARANAIQKQALSAQFTPIETIVREEVIPSIQTHASSTHTHTTPPQVQQATHQYQHITHWLNALQHLIQQRQQQATIFLGDIDRLSHDCYAPIQEFCADNSVALGRRIPLATHGARGLGIQYGYSDTSFALIRVPETFATSVWWWPAIAHEIAHDFYDNVPGFDQEVRQRLELNASTLAPITAQQYSQRATLQRLYAAWWPEIIPDILGTAMMGPAYVVTTAKLFANTDFPNDTLHAALYAQGNHIHIEEHPPTDLRVHIGCAILDELGQTTDARHILTEWNQQHGHEDHASHYFLPDRSNQIARFPAHYLREEVLALVRNFWSSSWQTLAGYPLIDIPGFSYLHHAHATVLQLKAQSTQQKTNTQTLHHNARLVVAAAVLAVHDQPDQHDTVLAWLFNHIEGIGSDAHQIIQAAARQRAPKSISEAIRSPRAIRDAIRFSEAFQRPQPTR